ncbi:hypothetical protein [Duncaniella freteri]|uniref:hypothetical protein n=1 Tax=Duncaniella freteri TaxID=2530391 RepID=UPI00258C3AD2|nr:hypothetical protein [Duncaniella freteri]
MHVTEVTSAIQSFYDSGGYNRTATATQLSEYLSVQPIQRTSPDGSRPRVYLVK